MGGFDIAVSDIHKQYQKLYILYLCWDKNWSNVYWEIEME